MRDHNKIKTICVIGGGPSGMMAAYRASNKSNKVILLEKNEKLGKKLFITGKGRCNVTNNCQRDEFFNNVVTNSKFLYSSYGNFSNLDAIDFFNSNGCPLKSERGGRVFPVSDKAYAITDCFKKLLAKNNVKINLNCRVKKIDIIQNGSDGNKFDILCEDTKLKDVKHIECDYLIIATGGYSYKSTGSDGFAYEFARKNNIEVTALDRGLVPLELAKADFKRLNNLTLKNIAINVKEGEKIIYKDFGELTFCEYGVYGPVILSLSSYISSEDIKKKKYSISIDLKPAINKNELDKRLISDLKIHNNKSLKNSFDLLLPKKLIPVFTDRLRKVGVDVEKNASEVTKNDREMILNLLKNFNYIIKKKRDFDEAIITKGGINVSEINPKTLEVKKIKNLYIVGESLDVDCLTGGFNITVALSTGALAGDSINNLTI